jgi:hypothetical protein
MNHSACGLFLHTHHDCQVRSFSFSFSFPQKNKKYHITISDRVISSLQARSTIRKRIADISMPMVMVSPLSRREKLQSAKGTEVRLSLWLHGVYPINGILSSKQKSLVQGVVVGLRSEAFFDTPRSGLGISGPSQSKASDTWITQN